MTPVRDAFFGEFYARRDLADTAPGVSKDETSQYRSDLGENLPDSRPRRCHLYRTDTGRFFVADRKHAPFPRDPRIGPHQRDNTMMVCVRQE